MPKQSIYDNGMYDELWRLAHELEPWFDIDKVKSHAVYVWTKGLDDDSDNCFGENVFDIYEDYLQFYQCNRPWNLTNEAMSIIKKIQEKLKEIDVYYNGG